MNQYTFQQTQYLLSLLPKECGICSKKLTRDDLTAGNIIANITHLFSILVCTEHFYLRSQDGEIEKTLAFDEEVRHFAFLTAREMRRANNDLRGHEPEYLSEEGMQCQKCGLKYKNFVLLGLIRCTEKFK